MVKEPSELQIAYERLSGIHKKLAAQKGGDNADKVLQQQLQKTLSMVRSKMAETRAQSTNSSDVNEDKAFQQQLAKTQLMLRAKWEEIQLAESSGMNEEDLNIHSSGVLGVRKDYEERLAKSTGISEEELWSSENLYRHLKLLENRFSRTIGARPWIEALLFRVHAILPSGEYMVINMDHDVSLTPENTSALPTPDDFVVHSVIVVNDECHARRFLSFPSLARIRVHNPSTFFILETKFLDPLCHVPQAADELYECAKRLDKKIIRGALTSGEDWIFLHLKMNDDGNGASYHYSERLRLYKAQTNLAADVEISRPWPDLIAAILSSWIENSHSEITDDDWFEAM
ncbi:unnamed protein product [Cyclocybe aegerita]|uniref:Uncharacterized protein n=1 Tax=Cyclocybe aegerita TaxID=1973307 RepID=A0A8S0VQQ4_CYCAE|nr:unnamed protein product [Cyclocybe aegerita]